MKLLTLYATVATPSMPFILLHTMATYFSDQLKGLLPLHQVINLAYVL